MKKISVKKEILTIALIIVAILVIGSQVFATGTTSDSPVQIPSIDTTTNSVDTTIHSNEVVSLNLVVPTTNIVTPTTNQVVSTYQNTTTLPQTGDASDYAIFMLIVVAIIIAIYAYKKVREYNI